MCWYPVIVRTPCWQVNAQLFARFAQCLKCITLNSMHSALSQLRMLIAYDSQAANVEKSCVNYGTVTGQRNAWPTIEPSGQRHYSIPALASSALVAEFQNSVLMSFYSVLGFDYFWLELQFIWQICLHNRWHPRQCQGCEIDQQLITKRNCGFLLNVIGL